MCRRNQIAQRTPKAYILVAVALVMAFYLTGCGGDGGGAEREELTSLIERRLCAFNRPVDLGGGRFTFTGWEWRNEIGAGEGEEAYRPLKGRYAVVFFTFQGSEEGPPEPLSPQLFKLKDIDGRLFRMDEDICEGPAEALAEGESRRPLGTLRWDQRDESSSFALFDVPYGAGTLTLVVDGPPGRSAPDDRIELVLEE